MSQHIEPFTSEVLIDYYTKKLGAVFDRQKGSHTMWRLPDGRIVAALVNGKSVVPQVMMRQIAGVLGVTYGELRSELGYPLIKSGKVKKGQGRRELPQRQTSKSDAKRAISDLAADVDALRKFAEQGVRDPFAYAEVVGACRASRERLRSRLGRVGGVFDDHTIEVSA